MSSKSVIFAAIICLSPVLLRAQICVPSVTVHNGLSINIHPIDTDGNGVTDTSGAVLRLSDLLVRADDRCNAGPLTFAIRRAGTGSGMPVDTTLFFDCTELGTQIVEVWVRNTSGLSNYSETYISVQDHFNQCVGNHLPISTDCAADVLVPEIFSYNKLAGSLRKTGSEKPSLLVSVSSFVHKTYDDCGGAVSVPFAESRHRYGGAAG